MLNPNSEKALSGSGPVVLVVDNGWAGAAQWGARTFMIERLIAEAEGQSRPLLIVPTANAAKALSLKVEAPAAARSTAAAVQPQPFAPDRMAAAQAIATALAGAADPVVVWLADGIDHDGKAREFADRLSALAGGRLSVVDTRPGQEALGAVAGVAQGGRLDAQVLRAEGGPRSGTLHAMSARGQRLGEAAFTLGAGDTRALATFDMPLELRNQVTRVEIAGERSAGAVHLLDARSQWHRIGLVSGASSEQAQPLLAPLYYIERALLPFSEIAKSDDSNLSTVIDSLIKRNVSAMMLADIGTLPHDIKERVEEWVKKGGILVRFAGPRLEKGGDDLLPVPLRLGGRTLGGALSWATPQPLAPFGDDSLFAGLTPPAEVLVNKQVLADPAGPRPRSEGVGAPQGRHAAGHRRQARRRPGDLLPCHRQLGLVEPAAVGPVRGDDAAHRQPRRHGRRRRSRWSATARAARRMRRPPSRCWRRCRCSTASACSRTRRRRPRPSPPPRSPTPSPAPSTRRATMVRPGRRARST